MRSYIRKSLEADQQRELWKQHPLYQKHTKDELDKMCRNLKIPVTPALVKHELLSSLQQLSELLYQINQTPRHHCHLHQAPSQQANWVSCSIVYIKTCSTLFQKKYFVWTFD